MSETSHSENAGSKLSSKKMVTFMLLVAASQIFASLVEGWTGNMYIGDAINGGLFGLIAVFFFTPIPQRTAFRFGVSMVATAVAFIVIGYVLDKYVFPNLGSV